MMLKNPWIDPRVCQVKPTDAEAYLVQRGWKRDEPVRAGFIPFSRGSAAEEFLSIQVPQLEHAKDYLQRMIEMIGDLAIAEDRYAAELLTEILHARGSSMAANGAGVPCPTETVAS